MNASSPSGFDWTRYTPPVAVALLAAVAGITVPRQVRTAWAAFAALVDHVVHEANPEGLQLWTAVNAFLWGAWLLVPWFDVFSMGGYGSMAAVLPEGIWGLIAVTVTAISATTFTATFASNKAAGWNYQKAS
jgi:mannose/fructose/N-acetylgalactosamine-specific phosphotransferase system component IIC